LFFTLLIPSLFFCRLYKQVFIIFITLSILCISLNETNNKNLIKINCNLSTYSNFYILKPLKDNKKKFFQIYKITFQIQISLSTKIIRFLLIIISFLLIHKLLVITTCNKDILFTYSMCFLYFFPFLDKDIFFILILSEECVYLLTKRIKNIQMSIYLKGNKMCLVNYHLKMINLYFIGINTLYQTIFMDVQTISCSLYSREIVPQTQKIWLLK
jgi:hypothetical protein